MTDGRESLRTTLAPVGGILAFTIAGAALRAAPPKLVVTPVDRTADMPDSWLLLYNLNSPQSRSWAAWYQLQRGIPDGNKVGLNASLNEHLDTLTEVQDQIITPVRDLLANDPALEQRIMGIILGFDLPGHYGSPPLNPGTGGFSIADALQDMNDDALPAALQKNDNLDNPHFVGSILPPGGRLTKATMAPNHYMVAHIDAPTWLDALAITQKALVIEDPNHYIDGENIFYDFEDNAFPAPNNEWFWLRAATEASQLADLPWAEFDMATAVPGNLPPGDAFRFSVYKLWGWTVDDFTSASPGSRVLGFHFNSYGAVTLRSTTAEGACYVPNALAAGYAAAIGATGEPQCCVAPFPDTLLEALRQGWTLGEAYYLANPYNDWMWTLVGDPLLRLPNGFDPPPVISPGDGDINGDGTVDGLDIQLFTDVFLGNVSDPTQMAAADLDASGAVDADDVFLMTGPLVYASLNPDELKGTGDTNGDGSVDGLDIVAFVDMLMNGTAGLPLQVRWAADMNRDGAIATDDVPLLVNALLQP
ncbi:MAG: TIGR03790 family protein [Phycisphaerae bacterium]